MIKTIVVDDEKAPREALRQKLELFCPEVQLCGEAEDIKSSIELIEEEEPGLIFLDINLKNESGFDILEQIPNLDIKDYQPEVIFITAHDEYAIRAIKFSALDYLLKPVDSEELVKAVRKYEQKTKSINQSGSAYDLLLENIRAVTDSPRKIMIPTGDGMHIVKISQIVRCESSSNYTYFYLQDKTRLLASKTLKEFDSMLTPYSFERVHKSHLVNLNYASKYITADGGYLVMEDGTSIPVANRKKDHLMKILKRV